LLPFCESTLTTAWSFGVLSNGEVFNQQNNDNQIKNIYFNSNYENNSSFIQNKDDVDHIFLIIAFLTFSAVPFITNLSKGF